MNRFQKTWHAWYTAKARCTDPTYQSWADYGGRGITFCSRWLEFSVFVEDMGWKPEGLWLDRIDNNKGYEPGNCRWATPSESALNRRIPRLGSNLNGVGFHTRDQLWRARGHKNGKEVSLYSGRDFFEAACARKAWEAGRGM